MQRVREPFADFFVYLQVMIIEILKSMLVGVCAAAPVGPVLIIILQRTMCHGRKAGLIAGAGSAAADALWATLGAFALILVQNFVDSHRGIILAIGGLLIAAIGLAMFLKDSTGDLGKEQPSAKRNIGYAVQTFLSAMSNPAALAVMLALLAMFKLDAANATIPVWMVIIGVGLGEFCYWALVTFLVSRFLRVTAKTLKIISKVAGAAIVGIGIFLAIKGLLMII